MLEVLVVAACLAILVVLLIPALSSARRKANRISCVSNLMQIAIGHKIWGGDHAKNYPEQVSRTNGGVQELAFSGDTTAIFHSLSNEIGSPKVLICPADSKRFAATNFTTDLKGKISYFVNVDAADKYPQMILAGDDNFEIGGVPVKSGLLEISSNTPVAWTAARHRRAGNLALADGSVAELTNPGLTNSIRTSGQATNRFAIP